jgi:hypothetical protein
LRLSVLRMLTASWMPQKNLVEMAYSWRFQPRSRMASPMIRSDSPPAYTSALSKKLTPASLAICRHSAARSRSTWDPKVTQEPNERTLT